MTNFHRKHVMCKEHLVSVDGDVRAVDCSCLPDDWHAINYVECLDSGKCYAEIEFVQDPFAEPWEFKGNKRLTKDEFKKNSECSHVFAGWGKALSGEEISAITAIDSELVGKEIELEQRKADFLPYDVVDGEVKALKEQKAKHEHGKTAPYR